MRRPSRRQLIGVLTGLGASAVGMALLGSDPGRLPLPSADPPRIGYLGAGTRESDGAWHKALVTGLAEHGYVDGSNIHIEWRLADGQTRVLPTLAAELVAQRVRVIVTSSTPAVEAAARATSTIPIVATGPGATAILLDRGLIRSVARPGTNVTGTCCTAPLVSKRVELLKEMVPGITRLAYLQNPNGSGTPENWASVLAAAQAIGLEAMHLQARTPDEIDAAVEAAVAAGANALHVNTDTLFAAATDFRIVRLAIERALPSMYSLGTFVHAGGLTAYAADIADMHRRAASHVDKLLKGADPAQLPLDLATGFEFLVNVTTAQTLGLAIPPDVAARVTEWVQ